MTLLESYTSHYFFSAIFQGDATLFSILVIFFIFKLQSLESEIQFIKNVLYMDKGHSIHQETVSKFQMAPKEERIQLSNAHGFRNVGHLLERWNFLEEQLIKWKNIIKKSSVPSIIILGLSIFGIVFASSLNYPVVLIGFSIINLFVIGLVGYWFFKA